MNIQKHRKETEKAAIQSQLQALLFRASLDGFGESFRTSERGLYSIQRSRYYRPEQVRIIRKIHLDSMGPSSNISLLYFVETFDGLKGIVSSLENSSGADACQQFMNEAERIQKLLYGRGLH
ncbi:MAG: hypothetical protein JST06_06810 [Bacteroidetes bacterium]|nr:hypothetical protein [Bacteroidota bacterium]MBS1629917.1 hypothetical protein [Bacteroidota bacterium]